MKLLGVLLSTILSAFVCKAQIPSFSPITGKKTTTATNIRAIYQDKKGNYWFGSDRDGLYRYDGKTLTLFTTKDGLTHNQVRDIQEDSKGNIWLVTGGAICSYNGAMFTPFTNNIPQSQIWKKEAGDLWFPHFPHKDVYRYDGSQFYSYQFVKPNERNSSIPYDEFAVYCIYTDRKGNIWFGTQNKGVCRFDGTRLTWFTDKGLDGAAVRSIFQDKAGNMWFGNNGYGLFRYDGKRLTNFTEEKGLGNPDFITKQLEKQGSMARIWSIDQDNSGNLWIATIDAGVWNYDGKKLTNYTTKNGLPSNSVTAVYKDRKGMIWFGTAGEICQFDGKGFVAVKFNK